MSSGGNNDGKKRSDWGGIKVEYKMTREDRAKQFMPFSALKGYEEELKKQEVVRVPKRELSEEYAENLDRKLRVVRQGDMVAVTYYYRGEYRKIMGLVSRVNATGGALTVVNTRIPFEDLYDIERV